MRWMRCWVFAVAAALAVAGFARADDYPSRPIRVIVPFSPGGAVDGPMRLIAQELGKRLGQAVVVENKPGAGATIGTDAVAKAAPDGYTLLLASQTNAISATLYAKLPFEPIDDFTPITLIGREPGVVVVNPSLPVTTLSQFIAYVKERPGKVDYASSGNGSGQHLFAALLASKTGMKMNHVPYRGRAGDNRSAVGRGGHGDSRYRRHGGPHQGRQAARARRDRCEALAATARRADSDGSRRAGLHSVRV